MINPITDNACNPHQSVVVEACAGSGKTWLLISRIFRLLLDDVAPEQILAITFTRKAAQEMKERLDQLLKELALLDDEKVIVQLQDRGLSLAQAQQNCQKAKQLFEKTLSHPQKVTIDTFHGWFSRLVLAAPMISDIVSSGNLREDRQRLLGEAMERWWFELGQGKGEFKHLKKMYLQLIRRVSQQDADAMLQGSASLLDQFAAWQQYLQYLPEGKSPLSHLQERLTLFNQGNSLVQLCDQQIHDWDGLQLAYDWYVQSGATRDKEVSDQLHQLIQARQQQLPDQEIITLLIKMLLTQKMTPRKHLETCSNTLTTILNQAGRQDLLEVIPVRLKQWIQKILDFHQFDQEKSLLLMNEAWIDLGTSMAKHFSDFKKNQRIIDFNDLELNVVRLLSDELTASYIQVRLDAKYKHILIDEFQDTNPLQWIILKAWLGAYGKEDEKPKIFIVGDPKQSIYRFRKADVRLFAEVQSYLTKNFDAVCLSQDETRRNPPSIKDALNQVFGVVKKRLNTDPNKETFRFNPHTTLWKNNASNPVIEEAFCFDLITEELPATVLEKRDPLITGMTDTGMTNPAYQSRQEASQVAQTIRHWLTIRQVVDSGLERHVRAARESDFLILVRTSTHIRQIESALREHRIAYQSPRKGGLLSSLEAQDIGALLQVLLTPSNNLALAHVLRTPIFDCGEDELQYLALHASSRGWWEQLSLAKPYPKLLLAYETLSRWKLKASYLPVHDLLDYIFEDGQLFEVYSRDCPSQMQANVIANLEAFLKLALDINGGRYPSLSRFIEELTILSQGSELETPDEGEVEAHQEDDTSPFDEEKTTSVRIMTIHSAKGLEAPFVFLMHANSIPQPRDSSGLLMDWPTEKDAPNQMFVYKKDYLGKNTQHFKDQELNIAEIENYNLLYVAMTRAKQCLVVSGFGKMREKSWYSLLSETGLPIKSFGDLLSETQSSSNVIHANIEKVFHPMVHFSKMFTLNLPEASPLVTDEIKGFENIDKPTEKQIEYQLLGQAVHQIFERLTPFPLSHQHFKLPTVKQLADWMDLPFQLVQPALKIVQQILEASHLQSYFYEGDIDGVWNEFELLDELGKLYRIDRLIEQPHQLVILDYKLSIPKEDHPFFMKYVEQLKKYRLLVQRMRSDKPVRSFLIDQHANVKEIV